MNLLHKIVISILLFSACSFALITNQLTIHKTIDESLTMPPQATTIGDLNYDNISDYIIITKENEFIVAYGQSDGSIKTMNTVRLGEANTGNDQSFLSDLNNMYAFVRSTSGQNAAYLGKLVRTDGVTCTRIALLLQGEVSDNSIQLWLLDINYSGKVIDHQIIATNIEVKRERENYAFDAKYDLTSSTHITAINYNDDTYKDLVFTHYIDMNDAEGKLWMYSMGPDGVVEEKWISEDHPLGGKIVISQGLCNMGDLNNDGHEDLVIGGTIYYLEYDNPNHKGIASMGFDHLTEVFKRYASTLPNSHPYYVALYTNGVDIETSEQYFRDWYLPGSKIVAYHRLFPLEI